MGKIDSARLLGAQAVALNAGDLIRSEALAIKAGTTVKELIDRLFA